MHFTIAPALGAAVLVGSACYVAIPALADEPGGISSPLISRCVGKLGAEARAGDQAFPLISLDGIPWVSIDHTQRKIDGNEITDTVTGLGTRHRRRGQVVGIRFTCLINSQGEAVAIQATDLLPEKHESLPPATLVRGTVFYPSMRLARGTELRVQLLDVARSQSGDVLSEVAVRTSWEEPIPFILRLLPATKLAGRKLIVTARMVLGSTTLYEMKQAKTVTAEELQMPLDLTLQTVVASNP